VSGTPAGDPPAPRAEPDAPGVLTPDDLPPDPGALVDLLARALARRHDRLPPDPGRDGPELDASDALDRARHAVASGWTPHSGSPFERVEPARLLDALDAGLERVRARSNPPVPTIGRARFSNLALPRADTAEPLVATAANIRLHRRRAGRPSAQFRLEDRAAVADPHRDLAVAAADVVSTFGPGAVPAFLDAYSRARHRSDGSEVVDPILLDWWSMIAAIVEDDRDHHVGEEP